MRQLNSVTHNYAPIMLTNGCTSRVRVDFDDSQVHFLTNDDAIDEFNLQPRSPGATSSDVYRQHSPQNSPRRGAHADSPRRPAVPRDVVRSSSTTTTSDAVGARSAEQFDLVPSAGVDVRSVRDAPFPVAGVGSLQPGLHEGGLANQGGCCGGRARQPSTSPHWAPPPELADNGPVSLGHAAVGQHPTNMDHRVATEAGGSKAHLP